VPIGSRILLGSFTVSGDQIRFFNDPHCTQVVGIYSWKLEEGRLALEAVEDKCFLDLRAEFHKPFLMMSVGLRRWNTARGPTRDC
jgi:hypothetical protein